MLPLTRKLKKKNQNHNHTPYQKQNRQQNHSPLNQEGVARASVQDNLTLAQVIPVHACYRCLYAYIYISGYPQAKLFTSGLLANLQMYSSSLFVSASIISASIMLHSSLPQSVIFCPNMCSTACPNICSYRSLPQSIKFCPNICSYSSLPQSIIFCPNIRSYSLSKYVFLQERLRNLQVDGLGENDYARTDAHA